MNIRVSEHFYSLQGEGATMGVPAVFIRLQACNLLCGGYGTQKDGKLHNGATWRCDTLDVWTNGKKNTVELFASKINELYGDVLREGAHLVWTGGEPMMQQDAICSVMEILHRGADSGHCCGQTPARAQSGQGGRRAPDPWQRHSGESPPPRSGEAPPHSSARAGC